MDPDSIEHSHFLCCKRSIYTLYDKERYRYTLYSSIEYYMVKWCFKKWNICLMNCEKYLNFMYIIHAMVIVIPHHIPSSLCIIHLMLSCSELYRKFL